MNIFIVISTATGFPQAGSPCPPLDPLRISDRSTLVSAAGVSMARRHAFASILAIAAARNCLKAHDPGSARIGVVAIGGSNHVDVAWNMTKGIIDEGSEFLDPLSFPHSIPSSIAASVAAACKAKAFAMGLGHDSCAFVEALLHASRLLRAGFADTILVIAVHHSSAIVATAAREGFGCGSADAAVCALLTTQSPLVPALELLDIRMFRGSGSGAAEMFNDIPVDRVFSEEILGAAKAGRSFAAVGGRLLVESSWQMSLRGGSARRLPFAVVVTGRDRSGIVVAWNEHLEQSAANLIHGI